MQLLNNLLSSDAYTPVNKYIAKHYWLQFACLIWELIRQRARFWTEEFYFSQQKIEDEIWIPPKAIRTKLSIMVWLWWITIAKKGIPYKNYYTIHDHIIIEFLQKVDNKVGENCLTSCAETAQPVRSKVPNQLGSFGTTIYIKNNNNNKYNNNKYNNNTVEEFWENSSHGNLNSISWILEKKLSHYQNLKKEKEKSSAKKEKETETSHLKPITIEINQVIDTIKSKCTECNVMYSWNNDDRMYARHLLSKKFQNDCLSKFPYELKPFIEGIIQLSTTTKYSKILSSAKSIYYDRAIVINNATKQKAMYDSNHKTVVDLRTL